MTSHFCDAVTARADHVTDNNQHITLLHDPEQRKQSKVKM